MCEPGSARCRHRAGSGSCNSRGEMEFIYQIFMVICLYPDQAPTGRRKNVVWRWFDGATHPAASFLFAFSQLEWLVRHTVCRIVKHRQSGCVALSSKCSFSRPSIARVRWIISKRHPNYYITRIAINYPLIIAMRASLDAPNLWIINGNSCSKNTVSSE